MSRLFYFGSKEANRQFSSMVLLDSSPGDVFYNQADGSYWKKKEINSMYIGKSTLILVRQPEPDTNQLLEVLFTSNDNLDVAAASLLLKENELLLNKEYRNELITELEQSISGKLNRLQKKRLENIIILTELHHGENRRTALHKEYDVVQADYKFYMDIAFRAEDILEKLQPNVLEKIMSKISRLWNS